MELDPVTAYPAGETRGHPRSRSSSGDSSFSDWLLVDGSEDSPSSDQETDAHDHSDDGEEEAVQDRYLNQDLDGMWVSSRSQNVEALRDLLRLVLPYLPAKPLLRLRCVSPLWNGFISNQFFVHSHSLHPRPVSGFFFHRRRSGDTSCESQTPAYAPFDRADHALPDPALSFLPEPVAAAASTRGLLCCRGSVSGGYYVCNPTTTAWVALPPPTNDHGAAPAVALVFDEPGVYNFHADYRVVCAYPIAGGNYDGIYGFETFSSAAWKWATSADICPAERILAGSGVAAGGKAYWRTTMEEVVAYDPVGDAWRTIARPWADLDLMVWELGEMGGRLSCTCVKAMSVTAWVMGGGGWETAGEWWVRSKIGEEWPRPLRTQGGRELLFWEEKANAVVARNFKGRVTRTLRDDAPSWCDDAASWCADFLPYVSTLVHVRRQAESPIGKNVDREGTVDPIQPMEVDSSLHSAQESMRNYLALH